MGKKVTMTDIAKAAGVSQTLVSFVLSGKNNMGISTVTKKKVLDTARKLGYCSSAASSMLKLGRSGYILLAFAEKFSGGLELFMDTLDEELGKFGFMAVLSSPLKEADAVKCISMFESGKVDGVIVYGEKSTFTGKLEGAEVVFEYFCSSSSADISECASRLCERVLSCGDVGGKAKRRKKTSVRSARVTGQKTVSEKSTEGKTESASRKNESIWLL